MDDDWDLHAVVRGCCATTTAATTITRSLLTSDVGLHSLVSTFPLQQDDKLFCFQDLLFESRNDCTTTTNTTTTAELHDLFKPFYPKPSPAPPQQPPQPLSPLSVLGGFQDLSQQQVQQNQQQVQLQQQLLLQTQLNHPKQLPTSSGVKRSSNPSVSNGVTTHTQSPRSKRRKNQMKRVCQVPAEGFSSDMWSWRKYGQKPIKGSPYPRGYYRCSTSKGCLARKQVERNKSDPNMFIVTYTGEHNHPIPTYRNSLAGGTRQKPAASGDAEKPKSSPPASPAASHSPAPEKVESSREEKEGTIEEDDDDFSISDMPLDDDFFSGLSEEFTWSGPAHNDCFPDHFPPTTQFPWLSNNVSTSTADGG